MLFIAVVAFLILFFMKIGPFAGGASGNLKSANIGDKVTFGKYEQDNKTSNGTEPIEWDVLDKKGNAYLLI